MHTSYRMMQTDVMWSDADELVFVRWGVCIWGGGATARSRIQCLSESGWTETAFVHVELLDQEKRGEESVTDRAERHGVRLRESSSAEVTPLLTCAYIFHSCASEKHLTSSLFLLSRVWCWTFITVCFCSSGLPSSTFESGMPLTCFREANQTRFNALRVYIRCREKIRCPILSSRFNESVRSWIGSQLNRFASRLRESARAVHHGVMRLWYLWELIRVNLEMWLMEWKVSYFNNTLAEMWHIKCTGDVFMRWFYDWFVLILINNSILPYYIVEYII